MRVQRRQVFAFSGMIESDADRRNNFKLTEYALTLAQPRGRPRLCYVPTAVGDSQVAIDAEQAVFGERRPEVEFSVLRLFTQPSVQDVRAHLLSQDVILVEGGSVVNLMAVWRATPSRSSCGSAGKREWFCRGQAPAVCAGTSAARLTPIATRSTRLSTV